MAIDLYESTIPLLLHHLGSLDRLLDKAAEYAAARGFDPANLLRARLSPDMFDLTRQIQIATDQAKGCGARLAGVEVPKFEDVETTIPELKARIARTYHAIGRPEAMTERWERETFDALPRGNFDRVLMDFTWRTIKREPLTIVRGIFF